MSATFHLALPYLDPAQAQKHVTHNEALRRMDAVIHLSVITRAVLAPPDTAQDGARYLIGTSPTGIFTGHAGQIAHFIDGAWLFSQPKPGWTCFVESESVHLVYDGTNWRSFVFAFDNLQNLKSLGLGTSADALNPLAVKLNTCLFTDVPSAEGGTGDLRFKLNKETSASTASQLYQSNWSGRAETGLMGDDHFRIKVSADGSLWRTALDIDPSSGQVTFPSGLTGSSGSASTNRIINGAFQINQRGYVSGTLTASNTFMHDRWKAGLSGCTYSFTQNSADTQITITQGSLVQIVEGANIAGGSHTLSWQGTARGRINAGTYSASPLILDNLSVGVPLVIEFNTGTLSDVMFTQGNTASPFQRRLLHEELSLCRRYYRRRLAAYANEPIALINSRASNSIPALLWAFDQPMRISPSCSLSSFADLILSTANGTSTGTLSAATFQSSLHGVSISNVTASITPGLNDAVQLSFATIGKWIEVSAEI